ncbi:hypothetical protein pdam_00000160 [Pocillopora damicornis]|uniref:Polyamine-modulated factor 1 n=1 Tax=Pocillopora damicornis TaxID=46731 RepID=A0A3M6UWZ2_POCDA|nr:hypothetical protein pdam_00000160 [Pocillopora damicornis]
MAASMIGESLESNSLSEKDSLSFEKQEESEGRRMMLFRKVMKKCLDKIMAAGSQEKFANCFSAMRDRNPAEFKSITEQLMEHLQNNIEGTLKNNKLIAKIRRPSGNPDKDVIDHVMQVKLAYKEQLKHILQQVENENEKLKDEVLPKREKLQESERRINEKTNDFGEAAEYCIENNSAVSSSLNLIKNIM